MRAALPCAALLALAALAFAPPAQAQDQVRAYAFCEHPTDPDGPTPWLLAQVPVPLTYTGPGDVRCGANVKERPLPPLGCSPVTADVWACTTDTPGETGGGLWLVLPGSPGEACPLGGGGDDCWGANVGYWHEARGDCVAQLEFPFTNDVVLCNRPAHLLYWCLDSGEASACTDLGP